MMDWLGPFHEIAHRLGGDLAFLLMAYAVWMHYRVKKLEDDGFTLRRIGRRR